MNHDDDEYVEEEEENADTREKSSGDGTTALEQIRKTFSTPDLTPELEIRNRN